MVPLGAALAILVVLLVTAADQRTLRLAANTLWLCGLVVAISVPLGTALAVMLARTDLPGRRGLAVLLAGLLLLPLYLQTAAWQAGFGTMGWFSLTFSAPVLLEGWPGAVWVHAVAGLPWVTLIVSAGLIYIPRELEEAALMDGSPGQVLRRVTLRRAWAAVGVAALWVAVSTASEITVTDLFQVRTYAEELYVEFAIGGEPGQPPLGAIGSTAVVALLVVAALALAAGMGPLVRHATQQSALGGLVFGLGRWRWPAALVVALVVLAVVGVPLASLAWKAGVEVRQSGLERTREWSLAKCLSIVATSPLRYQRPLFWSAILGCLAASTAVVAAVGLAWAGRRQGLRALPALVLAALSLAVPGPLVGLGLIWVLNSPDLDWTAWLYDRSIAAPWAALTVRAFPPALLIVWQALASVPDDQVDSAALEGAGRMGIVRRVVLPQRLAALGVAWLIALAVALGELGASILVVPPGVVTLSIEVFNLLHGGYEDEVAGICLAVFAGCQLMACIVVWLAVRAAARRAERFSG